MKCIILFLYNIINDVVFQTHNEWRPVTWLQKRWVRKQLDWIRADGLTNCMLTKHLISGTHGGYLHSPKTPHLVTWESKSVGHMLLLSTRGRDSEFLLQTTSVPLLRGISSCKLAVLKSLIIYMTRCMNRAESVDSCALHM